MSTRFSILGFIREAESGIGIPGLFVKAYDKDLLFDDLLGHAVTNSDGSFEIISESSDFREFFDLRPDIYLRVFLSDRSTQIWSSKKAVRWHAGHYEQFDISIPSEAIGEHTTGPVITLRGDNGEPEPAVQPGEPLTINASGLRPSSIHKVVLSDDEGEIAVQTLLSNAKGEIRDAVVWPLIGFDDPRSRERAPVEEIRKHWYDRTIGITLFDGERSVGKAEVTIKKIRKPIAVATDSEGMLLSGFEIGNNDARLTLMDFPEPGSNVRIWMVPRQHEWRAGDRITPVLLSSHRLAQVDTEIKNEVQRVVVADRDELVPGAYDFVIRPVRYGYEDDDDLYLRPDDIVSNRRYTGLVVREKFMASKVIAGGCTNLQEIACRRTSDGWPYVQFSDTFQAGEDIWGTMDPLALDPAHTGKMAALYVVPHKTAAEWADGTLNHLAVLGGNPAVQQWLTQSWCVNANLHLLWANANLPGEYDVVVDFGNNTADPAAFVRDDEFNMPMDIIDGYINPGFRVVPDPAADTSFANSGHLTYDEVSQGFVDVTDDHGFAWHVPLKASVHFPSDVPGATLPSQISAAAPQYPIVVVVHGNSSVVNGYQGYEYLLEHLARNGFIAASIHQQPGEFITDRARVLRRHLEVLFAMFNPHVENNVGLMGHSRGGEAVVVATRLNSVEAWGYNINAVIPLAPTNFLEVQLVAPYAKPLLVIYGSLDGDVAGIDLTGFEIYDNASGMKKSMMFVYRACHDRFNTLWGDADFYFGQMTAADQARVLTSDAHQKIAKSYMAAFFRQHLRDETQWEGLFKGEWIPASVQTAVPDIKIYPQYEDTTLLTVDNFEGPHNPASWQSSSLGSSVTETGLVSPPVENDLRTIDAHSPHHTAGLLLSWDTTTDTLHYDVPAGQRDVHTYKALSFRVSQRVNSASNPINQLQDLRLTLTDGAGISRQIRISKLTDIPYPDVRGMDIFTKSALRTIRIPLSAYSIKCYGMDSVDLHDIVSVSFDFAEKVTGEIEIDDLQFTN